MASTTTANAGIRPHKFFACVLGAPNAIMGAESFSDSENTMTQKSRVGEVVDGRYKLLGPVGSGTMGEVYVAQEGKGPYVALKLVMDLDLSMQARERFMREVTTLNRLEHPNIVELLDFGFEDKTGTPYMVMDLVMGDSLHRFPSRGRMSVDLVVHVARDVCLGLAAAHNQNIVHRDLKPANIMVFPENGGVGVKILDFGLAFVRDTDTKLTKTGTMPGTLPYMAPESLKGEPLDGRTDLYALGCIIYELLTSHYPFPGANDTQIGMAHLTQKPPKVRKAVKDVPAEVEEFILKLLSKDPKERPQTAGEAAMELTELIHSLGLSAPKTTHSGPSKNPVVDWGILPV